MQLSTKGRYAVRAMFDLSFYSKGEPVPLSRISEREEISLHYLEQLFNKLRKGGVVMSVRGPSGGFKLARKPSEITVEEIIRIVEGSIVPVNCVEHGAKNKPCHRAEKDNLSSGRGRQDHHRYLSLRLQTSATRAGR
jgi:Rrf2 family iron-sulfur cluster assembly transcriptional regulator